LKKKFVINLILLVFINLLIKPFWVFGIDRSIQNLVGAEEYGLYASIFSFSFLLNIILDLGITSFNNRNISQHKQLLSKHFSNIVILKFLLGVLYFLISLIIAIFIDYNYRQLELFLFLGFNQFLLSFILYLRSNIAGLQLFKTDSLISVLDRSLMILFCGILLWGNCTDINFKIEWFVYAQNISYLITAVVAFFIVFLKSKFLKLNFNRKFFLVILKKSYPFAILFLLMGVYTRVDIVMIERLLIDGKLQAGIYAQSFRILDAASMFALLFSSLLLPMFSKMLKNKENVGELTRLSYKILIAPAIMIAVISWYFKIEILEMLYNEHIKKSSEIFGVLMMSFVAIATTNIFGTLLTANANLKALNLMAAFGMFTNFILNFILIPKYQALGAAIASLITQFLTAFIQIFIANNKFKGKLINKKMFFYILIFTLVICFSGGIIYNLEIENWLIKVVILSVLGTILYLFMFFSKKIILKLLKKNNLFQ